MAKVYDVFTFFNELDLLELRLEMMDSFVDKFVIIECVETFSGNKKPLYYEENKERFKKYHHKIIHHITYDPPKSFDDLRQRILDSSTDDLMKQICIQALTTNNVPPGELHWLKEFYQKEYIRLAIKNAGAQDDDLCFVGDLDEIWNPELNYFSIDNHIIYKLKQLVYVGYMNNRSNESWAGTLLSKYRNIKGACLNHLRTPSKTNYEYIDNAGWHFSFMGGEDRIKLKIESYGHQEFNNDQVKSQVIKNLDSGKDILGRSEFHYRLDESELPTYIKDNKEKYKHLFK
jgi:beta-1,4-mannosyl-glycoprotein beta-1,4-N-acetylglucosaminyltransferase